MDEKKEIIDDSDPLRKSQNRIISILFLYIVAIFLFIFADSPGFTTFDLIIYAFFIANTLYLIKELISMYQLRQTENIHT